MFPYGEDDMGFICMPPAIGIFPAIDMLPVMGLLICGNPDGYVVPVLQDVGSYGDLEGNILSTDP
jgi:hypothetical protein